MCVYAVGSVVERGFDGGWFPILLFMDECILLENLYDQMPRKRERDFILYYYLLFIFGDEVKGRYRVGEPHTLCFHNWSKSVSYKNRP